MLDFNPVIKHEFFSLCSLISGDQWDSRAWQPKEMRTQTGGSDTSASNTAWIMNCMSSTAQGHPSRYGKKWNKLQHTWRLLEQVTNVQKNSRLLAVLVLSILSYLASRTCFYKTHVNPTTIHGSDVKVFSFIFRSNLQQTTIAQV